MIEKSFQNSAQLKCFLEWEDWGEITRKILDLNLFSWKFLSKIFKIADRNFQNYNPKNPTS